MQKRSIVIFFFLVPFLIVALFLTSCYLTKKELNQGRRKEYAQRQQQTINEDSKFVHKKEITFLFCSLSCFLQQQQQLLFLWMCLFFFVTLRAEIGRFFARAVNVNPTNSSAKLLSQQQLLYSKAITFEQQHLHLFSSLFPWNLTDLSVSLRRKSFLASIFELLALSYSVRTPRHAWTRFVCHSLAIQHHLLLLIILILIKFEENGSGWIYQSSWPEASMLLFDQSRAGATNWPLPRHWLHHLNRARVQHRMLPITMASCVNQWPNWTVAELSAWVLSEQPSIYYSRLFYSLGFCCPLLV